MSAVDFLKQNIDFIHRSFRMAADGLSPEQVHFVPQGESHSIAWVMWHAARIEDLFFQQVFQGKQQEWEAGGWAERTGLPAQGFGTGQSTEDAKAVRIKDLTAFSEYASRVAELTRQYLDTITDADLTREVKLGQRIETLGQSINLHIVTHLNGHRGEVNLIRGMLGLGPVMPNQGG